MSLLNIALVLIVVSVLLWLANRSMPMNRKTKMIVNGVVFVIVFVWLLSAFGLFSSITTIQIGK